MVTQDNWQEDNRQDRKQENRSANERPANERLANERPETDNARNVLSQEELDFLLSAQMGGEMGEDIVPAGAAGTETAGRNAHKDAVRTNAASRNKSLAGKKKGQKWRREPLADAGSHAAEDARVAARAASCSGGREQKRFFAVTLERSLRRATGSHVGIRFDGDTTLSPKELDELAGTPACFVEISSPMGAGIVFCLDNHAAQALVNASLGQGRGPARTEGPLSLFDRELVRRSLDELGEAFAQAFDCPCAACVRLAWHADGMFRARSGNELGAAEFSMETGGQPGRAWLFAPTGAA